MSRSWLVKVMIGQGSRSCKLYNWVTIIIGLFCCSYIALIFFCTGSFHRTAKAVNKKFVRHEVIGSCDVGHANNCYISSSFCLLLPCQSVNCGWAGVGGGVESAAKFSGAKQFTVDITTNFHKEAFPTRTHQYFHIFSSKFLKWCKKVHEIFTLWK